VTVLLRDGAVGWPAISTSVPNMSAMPTDEPAQDASAPIDNGQVQQQIVQDGLQLPPQNLQQQQGPESSRKRQSSPLHSPYTFPVPV
jgi:hypothetical protein